MIFEKTKIDVIDIAKQFNNKKYGMKMARAIKSAVEELEEEGVVLLRNTIPESAYFISEEAVKNENLENYRVFKYGDEYLKIEKGEFIIIPFDMMMKLQ